MLINNKSAIPEFRKLNTFIFLNFVSAASSCSMNNGGCAYLCLPGREGVHCACPDNIDELEGC